MGTYNIVVCRHDGRGIRFFDGDLERSEVDLPQDPFVDLHVVFSPRSLRIIADEMLESGLSTLALNACQVRYVTLCISDRSSSKQQDYRVRHSPRTNAEPHLPAKNGSSP
jgi:hypothetical protein